MTQLKEAKAGKVTEQMEFVARAEHQDINYIRETVKVGRMVIPCNKIRWEKIVKHPPRFICGIGERLKTKVNANIGTSSDYADIGVEIRKLKVAEEVGADTIMDLSTGGDVTETRQSLLKACQIPFGTVPIYEAVFKGVHPEPERFRAHQAIKEMAEDTIFQVIEQHAKDGVDFMTIHSGVTRDVVKCLDGHKRVGGMVSRGGTILTEWMRAHKKENPLYERFDELLEIAREYDVTLSLGDGLRPGALADSFDRAQVAELMVLSELARRARAADVQVMIEGPGHVPLNQIQAQVQLQKQLCDGAPFYVLGPLVTDVAPGYDHITSAIGGALAAWAGADFLCYVTPMEHLGLPAEEHVREGVMASRIAARAADIAKGVKGVWDEDKRFSEFRSQRNWEKQIALALDSKRATQYRNQRKPKKDEVCSMCGEICAYEIMQKEQQSH